MSSGVGDRIIKLFGFKSNPSQPGQHDQTYESGHEPTNDSTQDSANSQTNGSPHETASAAESDPHRECSSFQLDQSEKDEHNYRVKNINTNEENWIESLRDMVEVDYRQLRNTTIRLDTLDILAEYVRQFQYIHEDLLFDLIIIPYLSNIESETNAECRSRAVKLIIELAKESISAKRCAELLEILDRVCKRPFDQNVSAGTKPNEPIEVEDVKIAVDGLIYLFKSKLYTIHSSTAIQAFKILVSHLSGQYHADYNCCFGLNGSAIKQVIFELLLSIRANSRGQIGVYNRTSKADNTPKYSLFIVCERNQSPSASTSASPVVSATTTPQSANPLSPPASPILHSGHNTSQATQWTLSFQDMFKELAFCLTNERDWTVLKQVLTALPKFLKNKAIILSGSPTIAHELCHALCGLIKETPLNKIILPNDQKLSKADFQSFVYPSVSAMVGYQKELEFRQQCQIIRCLQDGLVSVSGKTSVLRQCILSLTICAVEMQEAMTKCLPETLLILSKISATVPLAIPKLEFLSNIILLPPLYQSFTLDQYMSVFAIALPYTNPFKFNEYTVALAHRVIAMWFLKCRLPCRKSIVPFIIKGLETNVLQEEQNYSNHYEAQRLRSSSLNAEQQTTNHKKVEARLSLQSTHPPPPSTPQSSHSHFSFSFSSDSIAQHNQLSNINENEFQEFRHELVETCMDMLATYTFGQASTVPLKEPMIEPLLDRNKSESWIMGHKLITITTSGCGSRAVKNGLCDKCLNMCRNVDYSDALNEDIQTNSDIFQSSFESSTKERSESTTSTDSVRRRHQSELGHINRPQQTRPQSAFDDSFLRSNLQKSSSMGMNSTTLCSCWCQGWAEIVIRRPTGVITFITRLQNCLGNFPYSSSPPDELPDFTSLLRPNRTRESSVDHSLESQAEVDNDSVFPAGATSSPHMDESSHHFDNLNGGDSPYTFRPVEPPVAHPMRTSPFQPVTRAQSFGSRNRSDFRQRLLDRKEYRSNDLESNIELPSHRSVYSRENSGDVHKSRAKDVPLKFKNEAESMSGPRERVHTISVMSPVSANRRLSREVEPSYSFPKSSGLCPRYVFLQFFYNPIITDRCAEVKSGKDLQTHDQTKPIILPKNEAIDRSLKNLDRITPYETHKIGVLYVGPDQAKDKTAIWSNPYGSSRFVHFIKGLGRVICLEDTDSHVYVGGLDLKGQDGKYAIAWEDNLVQVIFHVATLMPTKVDTDPHCNNKKRHIGNDYVCIVYNESGSTVNLATIKGDGQFTQAIVVITPYDYNSNLVMIQAKDDFLDLIGHYDSQMLSDNALPVYVRQLALHANLGSMVYNGTQTATTTQTQHVSNWVQRLKQIKRIRQRVTNKSGNDPFSRYPSQEQNEDNSGANPLTGDIKSQYLFPDFNDYT